MPAKRSQTSIVVVIATRPRTPPRRDAAGEAALQFVTSERGLIRAMISEFLGSRGIAEEDDVVQELWIHLRCRLVRRMPRQARRRAVMITATRNFFRNLSRRGRARKRRPHSLLSLNRPLPPATQGTTALEDFVSQHELDTRRGGHPNAEQAAEWRLDLAGAAAKLPANQRSFLERLMVMSLPEAAHDLRIATSTGYRWRLLLRERFLNLLNYDV